MTRQTVFSPKWLVLTPLLLLLLAMGIACGDDVAVTPIVIEKEVVKEVPVEVVVVKEVVKEVPVEVVVEKEVVKLVEVVKEVIVVATPTPTPPSAKVGAVYGGDINYLATGVPSQWDPHLASGLESNAAISPLYNQLVEFNPNNPSEIIGDLAKSWAVTDNGSTYTFTIHENVKWSDGGDLTAEDVAFSINRMIEPGEPRPRVGLLRTSTESAEVIDQNTVKVNLIFASAAFLPFLAVDYMKIVPKHIIDAGIDINVHGNIVNSGPFIPKVARQGAFWQHVKNPNYFKDGLPYFDSVKMTRISDPGTIAAAFNAELIHISSGSSLSLDDALNLEDDLKGRYTFYWSPGDAVQHFVVNSEKEPWTDLRIIHALRLATNQWEIKQAISQGQYSIGAPFPVGAWYGHTEEELKQLPGYGGCSGCPRTKEQDIADAVALLKEAGYDPPSELPTIEFNLVVHGFFPDLVQLWAQQMKKNLGVDVDIQTITIPGFVNALISGEFGMGIWGYALNITDPDDYVNAIYGPGSRNYTRHTDSRIPDLFTQQSREQDLAKRKQILQEMEAILLEESPYIELMWPTFFSIVSDKIRTEAGAYVPSQTRQTILKLEHMWLEK